MNCGCDDTDELDAPAFAAELDEISEPMVAATNVNAAALLGPTQSPGVVVGLAELGPPGWIVLAAFALVWIFGGKNK